MPTPEDFQDKDKFLYPRSTYHGKFTPQRLAFNANLQEFAQRVAYLSNLTNNGKLDIEEAYQSIKQSWKTLKRSRKELNIDTEPPADPPDSDSPSES